MLASWADILDLDLAGLSAGRSVGLTGLHEPIFAVCTHGRHDPCCAERGRPVAAAMAAAHPQLTWECSHLGGDRFAGNVLVLPDGIYYGRVGADRAAQLIASHRAGRLDLAHLRGWSAQPAAVQVAEIALRRRLGEDRIAALRPVGTHRDGPTTTVRIEVEGAPWTVLVTAAIGEGAARLTCHAQHADPLPNWQVTIHPGSAPAEAFGR